ncbi:MlaA family lipoprotein [Rhodoferax antarcticus]|uniref:VacJ-like lipoprotein n=1 Tax=Rhodoferax antarcticus ANT.BR TaxID=1111071 RepID=A0A1Q8YKY6_9BURK|nr:VacJ family lipoprotein [Rhodoferax antarcticus]APW47474.1 ABC transporter [Rhodoferax antarcticus]MCW2311767.1 phospholipid-binding lipoprotein MlaA [Rhodoferax antarcticus]OLP08607.1 VacJ-like lipoprotein [Rhodoferax antarcticus ANT.BR]
MSQTKSNQRYRRFAARTAFLTAALLLSACATGPNADPRDPLEPFNRGMYSFNDVVDRAVVKPVATAYRDVLPSPVRTGVSNFFSNLQDLWSFVNNALQLKGEGAGNSIMRFGVNTAFGLGGVLDIASEMRIERFPEDFGQTLGHWGVGAGPYVVLPLLGPSTLRDTAALPVDSNGNALSHVSDIPARNSATVLNLVNRRSRLLDASKMLEEVALDPYTFTRDAFLQRRQSLVYDGSPPDQDDLLPTYDNPAQ